MKGDKHSLFMLKSALSAIVDGSLHAPQEVINSFFAIVLLVQDRHLSEMCQGLEEVKKELRANAAVEQMGVLSLGETTEDLLTFDGFKSPDARPCSRLSCSSVTPLPSRISAPPNERPGGEGGS